VFGSEAEFDEQLRRLRSLSSQAVFEGRQPESRLSPSLEQKSKKPQADWWKKTGMGDFFRVPNPLHRSGIAARIGPTVTALYLGLLDQAARRNSNRFGVSDRKLSANTGISPRTMVELRKVLVESGLIRYSTAPGHSPVYELLAFDAQEIPYENRQRAKKRARGRSAPRERVQEFDPWNGLPQILRGTSAKYARPYAKFA